MGAFGMEEAVHASGVKFAQAEGSKEKTFAAGSDSESARKEKVSTETS